MEEIEPLLKNALAPEMDTAASGVACTARPMIPKTCFRFKQHSKALALVYLGVCVVGGVEPRYTLLVVEL